MDIQAVLEKVAQQGLAATSGDEIMLLACAYWHENFNPDLARVKQLTIQEQKVIGYLTKYFSAFNCIDEPHALELIDAANQIKAWAKPTISKDNDDDFAAEWGLADNINQFLPDILFMQTRHYIHTPWSELSCYK